MKGQLDLIYIPVFIIALVIGLAVVWTFYGILTAAPQYQSLLNKTATQHIINQGVANSETTLNDAIIVIFIFLALVSLILAAFADSSPVFALLGIIVLPAEMIVAFVFHDLFFQIMGNSFFASWVSSFPGVQYIFQYFPLFIFILWFITIVITFIK